MSVKVLCYIALLTSTSALKRIPGLAPGACTVYNSDIKKTAPKYPMDMVTEMLCAYWKGSNWGIFSPTRRAEIKASIGHWVKQSGSQPHDFKWGIEQIQIEDLLQEFMNTKAGAKFSGLVGGTMGLLEDMKQRKRVYRAMTKDELQDFMESLARERSESDDDGEFMRQDAIAASPHSPAAPESELTTRLKHFVESAATATSVDGSIIGERNAYDGKYNPGREAIRSHEESGMSNSLNVDHDQAMRELQGQYGLSEQTASRVVWAMKTFDLEAAADNVKVKMEEDPNGHGENGNEVQEGFLDKTVEAMKQDAENAGRAIAEHAILGHGSDDMDDVDALDVLSEGA